MSCDFLTWDGRFTRYSTHSYIDIKDINVDISLARFDRLNDASTRFWQNELYGARSPSYQTDQGSQIHRKQIDYIILNAYLADFVKGRPTITRKMRSNTSVKGDRLDITSFLSCYDSEPKVAAYLGYRDMAEFRKYLFSFHVVDFFNVYSAYCSGRSGKVALELIRDLLNPEALFPYIRLEAVEIYTGLSKATSTEQ